MSILSVRNLLCLVQFSLRVESRADSYLITKNSLIGSAVFATLSISARILLRTWLLSLIIIPLDVDDDLESTARCLAKGARHPRHPSSYFGSYFIILENAQAGFSCVEVSVKWLAVPRSLLRLPE